MWAGNVWRAALRSALRGGAGSALAQLRGILDGELEGIRGAGTWKSERVIMSRLGPHIRVDRVSGGILNFCANNYLGLSSHPEVIQAVVVTPMPASEALLTPEDAVLSDELNYAAIIHGICLCKANNIPPQEICRLAFRHGALVFVDEGHATGFLGPTRGGTDELLDVMGQVTIINSSLGKALGGATGGYMTGHGPLVSLLPPGPTSSLIACHLLLLAALPRP
ncbi:hypothetical protein H8959_011632 [Pygathrix nigripes]